MDRRTIDQAFQIALQHQQAGRLQQAEQIYRQILAQQPKYVPALHFLGLIAHQVGRHDAAAELIRQAIALNPKDAAPHSNLGRVLLDMGKLDEAIAACRAAIALNPQLPEAHYNLGSALQAKGQLDEAIAAYRQAISINPKLVEALNNLGNALKEKGELDESIAVLWRAIALRPNYADAYSNLGIPLRASGRFDEAIAAFRQAIALKPGLADAHSNLGRVLLDTGYPDESIAECQKAIALKPEFPEAHSNLGNALKDTGRLDDAIAAFRQVIALRPSYAEADSNLILTLQYHPACDAQAVAEEQRRWNRQHAQPLKKFIQARSTSSGQAHDNDWNPDRRLRIGYVSPDFRGHSVGRFLLPLLANHDKRQFKILAYAQVFVPDAMTQRLRSHIDGWRNIVGLSDVQAAELIRQDRIDILIDLAMHTADNRLLVFAHKPAPVQATYLAYCSSTGMEAIDYRLSDPYLDPPGGDESIYSEQTVRLPETYWCYQPLAAPVEIGPLPALTDGSITFGCLNNFCKVNDPMLSVWAGILRALPNSRLLLHAYEGSHRQRIIARMEQEGVPPERIRFAPKLPPEKYFELYRQIDIVLDTLPFGGGTTTCDALWMGVPVVSQVGTTAVGRAGLSILSNIGMPDLVAGSQEQYVQFAVELANDLPRLGDLRLTLRRRMEQSPLMDAPRFAGNIEAAYRRMWRTRCADYYCPNAS